MSERPPAIPDDKAAPIFGVRAGATRNARTAWRCHLGRRLHEARQAHRGLDEAGRPVTSRRELGKMLQLGERAIWEIENGLASLDAADLALFGEALNVHPGSFFDNANFVPLSSMGAARLSYVSVASALAQMGETERDIVLRLIMFLSSRCGQGAILPERSLPYPAADQSMTWA
jgi:hypothetical protein